MEAVGIAVPLKKEACVNGRNCAGSIAEGRFYSEKEDVDVGRGSEEGSVSPVVSSGVNGGGSASDMIPIEGLQVEMEMVW